MKKAKKEPSGKGPRPSKSPKAANTVVSSFQPVPALGGPTLPMVPPVTSTSGEEDYNVGQGWDADLDLGMYRVVH